MKKIPISISIITAVFAPLVGIANVGATANTNGPWSFDELLSARTELKAEVDANCPRSLARLACVDDIKAEKGGVVSNGIMQTEHLQFLPVSVNFATDTFEYYYSSDSLSRNFDWHLPYKNILPTKLVLIQADAEYVRNSAEWSDLIMVSDENPNWKTLYSDEAAEGEDSILLLNQKASLDIEHPVFDTNYEKAIRGYIEYSTGDYTHFVFTFENTKDGRKYDAWFGREEIYPYFDDPSYNDGYQDGLVDGHDNGYTDGYTNGYNEGYAAGLADGQSNGYNNGYTEGLANGYENGYANGYNTGYDEGLIQGHEDGFIEGANIAYQDGFNEGYEEGYRDGQNEATTPDGNETSNNPDLNTIDEVAPDTSNDSDSTNTQTEESSLSPKSNILNQSTTNILKVNNNLKSGNQKASASIKKPNTGAATAESGSSEAEWWLGAIFMLGLGTLLWLFWPSRQKKSKK